VSRGRSALDGPRATLPFAAGAADMGQLVRSFRRCSTNRFLFGASVSIAGGKTSELRTFGRLHVPRTDYRNPIVEDPGKYAVTGGWELYAHAESLFRDLAMARADGSLRSLLSRLSRIDVLVIDDLATAPLSEPERRNFWEICEDRYQVRSTILTSQLPVSRWHEQIGDPTLADSIRDRLVHNAHRIEMKGDSMRKNRGKPSA